MCPSRFLLCKGFCHNPALVPKRMTLILMTPPVTMTVMMRVLLPVMMTVLLPVIMTVLLPVMMILMCKIRRIPKLTMIIMTKRQRNLVKMKMILMIRKNSSLTHNLTNRQNSSVKQKVSGLTMNLSLGRQCDQVTTGRHRHRQGFRAQGVAQSLRHLQGLRHLQVVAQGLRHLQGFRAQGVAQVFRHRKG